MAHEPPRISVVFATHDRAERLEQLLASLRAQSLPLESFEVVAVDDGSSDETPAVLAGEQNRGELRLRTVRLDPARGPAVARNAGWQAAAAPIVAFTDDDCVASPGWLEAAVRGAESAPGAVLQGRTDPRPDELDQWGPFSRTLEVRKKGPYYQTCNVIYPRAVLVSVRGFDEETFTVPGGEDADLAWRAMGQGATTEFVEEARVFHAVSRLGPLGKLRVAWRWAETVRIYARHPELRRTALVRGLFWKRTHPLLLRLMLALLLPGRHPLLRGWLAYPYLRHLPDRGRIEGGGLAAAPYYVLYDLVEVAAMVRGSLRYRTFVL